MAEKENKHVVNRKAQIVFLENDINVYRKHERLAKERNDYAEALENQMKADALISAIAKYLV